MAIFILIYFSLYCCDFLISWHRHPPSNLSHPPHPKMMNAEFSITLELESEQPVSHFKRLSDLPVVFGPGEENDWYITAALCCRAGQRAPWNGGSRALEAERRGMGKCQWADSWEELREEMAKSIRAALESPGLSGGEGQAPGKCGTEPQGESLPRNPRLLPWVKGQSANYCSLSGGAGIVKVFVWFL